MTRRFQTRRRPVHRLTRVPVSLISIHLPCCKKTRNSVESKQGLLYWWWWRRGKARTEVDDECHGVCDQYYLLPSDLLPRL